jgi:hypothetical protein
MKHVILITGAEHYDASSQTSREPDDEVLRHALLERGIDVQVAVWNDLTIDWEHMAQGAIVVIRSCWDYHCDREGFLAWSERIARMTTLLNPVEVLRWNTHKRYLQVLARHGIPTIPTVWLPQGTSLVLADLLAERRWSSAVIKPAVSTNAYATFFVDAASLAAGEAQAHLNTWACEREMMIQPSIDAVREVGEHALVFIAGEHPIIPTNREVHLARKILRIAAKLLGMYSSSSFLFARVDLIDDAGTLRLMELELVEPRLRLCDTLRGKERLVAAITAHCVASRTQPLSLAS